jgi:hypothetical protein
MEELMFIVGEQAGQQTKESRNTFIYGGHTK